MRYFKFLDNWFHGFPQPQESVILVGCDQSLLAAARARRIVQRSVGSAIGPYHFLGATRFPI
jgi:hypothetical protein